MIDVLCVVEGEKVGDDNRTEILFDRLMLVELRDIMSKLDPKAYAELRSYHEPPKVSHTHTAPHVPPRTAQGQSHPHHTTCPTTNRPRSVTPIPHHMSYHEPPNTTCPTTNCPRSVTPAPHHMSYHELPKVSHTHTTPHVLPRTAQGQSHPHHTTCPTTNCPRSVTPAPHHMSYHEPPNTTCPTTNRPWSVTPIPHHMSYHEPPNTTCPTTNRPWSVTPAPHHIFLATPPHTACRAHPYSCFIFHISPVPTYTFTLSDFCHVEMAQDGH